MGKSRKGMKSLVWTLFQICIYGLINQTQGNRKCLMVLIHLAPKMTVIMMLDPQEVASLQAIKTTMMTTMTTMTTTMMIRRTLTPPQTEDADLVQKANAPFLGVPSWALNCLSKGVIGVSLYQMRLI